MGREADGTGRNILAMEYCNGGSLQDMIEQNENGVQKEVFFTAVEDLTNALMHLYHANIIHRDIKPDNVMVHEVNGRMIFKLGDFGVSKVLQHHEAYFVVNGTYEYMHPDLFARLFREKLNLGSPPANFGYRNELWSIGVTFYELATGRLPFIPEEGRKNVRGMYRLISKKCDGVIAKDKNEIPQYILPATSHVNQSGVVYLISGLLNLHDVWDFEKFGRQSKLVVLTKGKMFDVGKENRPKQSKLSKAMKPNRANDQIRHAKKVALAAIGLYTKCVRSFKQLKH